jgi:hypothetical protein
LEAIIARIYVKSELSWLGIVHLGSYNLCCSFIHSPLG